MNANPKAFGKLICLICEQKIEIRVEDDQLRCRAPKGVVTDKVLREIRRFKTPLVQLFGPTRYTVNNDLPWGER